ncbi:phosphotransferase family protein [Flindersiella endophytica]
MNLAGVESVATNLGLPLIEHLSGGHFGATLVTTGRGTKAVLKVLPKDEHWSEERVRSAIQTADTLRRDGYPIPRFLDSGVVDGLVFTLQEFVDGASPSRLRPAHAERLIELRQRHVGAAPAADRGWGDRLVASIRPDTGEVQTLLRYAGDERVLGLLDEALTAGERIDPAGFRGDDVMHNDFGMGNALVRGDEVVAVIDWEGARAGDSRSDLATLAFYHLPETTDPAVFRRLETAIGEMPAGISAALAVKFALGRLYFALRVGDPALLTFTLDIAGCWLRPLWRGFLH